MYVKSTGTRVQMCLDACCKPVHKGGWESGEKLLRWHISQSRRNANTPTRRCGHHAISPGLAQFNLSFSKPMNTDGPLVGNRPTRMSTQ